MEFRVLAVGDVVGAPGLRFLQQKLRGLKRLYNILAVGVISGIFNAFDTRLLDFYHIVLPSF